MRRFTIDEVRAVLPALQAHVEQLVALRADLAEAGSALADGGQPPGGLPQVKALEARLQESIDWFADRGIQVKGIAPVIVDFPGEVNGDDVLLCWLEGETELAWYHPESTGFMGRRRLQER